MCIFFLFWQFVGSIPTREGWIIFFNFLCSGYYVKGGSKCGKQKGVFKHYVPSVPVVPSANSAMSGITREDKKIKTT